MLSFTRAGGADLRYKHATDESLIASCLAGHDDAWRALIDRYAALIYSVPLRLGLAQEDAGDIFQDVCLLLYDHLADLRDARRLPGWLASTARREVWRFCRRRKTVPISDFAEQGWLLESATAPGQEPPPAPEAFVLAMEEQQMVRRALSRLPDRCRTLLTLLYIEDPPLSYAEAGERLDMPMNSIGPNRARCLQKMLRLLGNAGF